ncbi:MAG: Hsp20/alpha crystallin family protein [Limisphaerales bacterium]
MNALAQWNQPNEVEDLPQSLGSLFSRPCVHWPEQYLRAPQRIPLVAVTENARGYVLKAELPQVKQEDAKIAIEDGTLTITGDRTFDLNRKKDHPAEHAYGRFAHSFEVPADARPAKVNAVFKKGVLTVHLAKRSCARFASRPDVSRFPALRLNHKDQFNDPEHEPKS